MLPLLLSCFGLCGLSMRVHAQKAEQKVEADDPSQTAPKGGQIRKDNGLQMVFHFCPAGNFLMGSPGDEPGRDEYEVAHEVTLTRDFWIGETEVTQGQWQTVMKLSLRDQARKMLADETLYPFNGKQITLREASNAAPGAKAVETVSAATAPNIPIYYVSWMMRWSSAKL